MEKIDSKSYSQIYCYLNVLGINYIKKIPKDIYSKIIKMKEDNYNPKFIFKDFNGEETSETTRYIILYFYLNYWCESEQTKKKILNKLEENEKKLNEKYDPFKKNKSNMVTMDNIEKNPDSEIFNKNNNKKIYLVEKKERWYDRFFALLKRFLKK